MKATLLPLRPHGDDIVVDAARVSFANKAANYTAEQNERLINYLAKHRHWSPFAHARICFTFHLREKDVLNFLSEGLSGFTWKRHANDFWEINGSLWAWREGYGLLPVHYQEEVCSFIHLNYPVSAQALGVPVAEVLPLSYVETPSSTATIYRSFHIEAPVFVARQLDKHQKNLVKNEVSRRYVTIEPKLYLPERFHKAADNVKQGSSDQPFDSASLRVLVGQQETIVAGYEIITEQGIAPEEARLFLPQNMETQWIWTGNLDAFYRVIDQRTDSNAQRHTRMLVEQMAEELENA